MAAKKQERKQKTAKGYEIPVPRRGNVLGLLRKAAKQGLTARRPKK